MANPTPKQRAVQLLGILDADRESHLLEIDAYARGIQADPYMPKTASPEYKLLAKRAVTNVMPFLEQTPAEGMYVDSFRRGQSEDPGDDAKTDLFLPEWLHWQRSHLDSRQHPIYQGAFRFGHSFTLTEKSNAGVITKGLSALKTSAIFEDPANDMDPLWAITVTSWPKTVDGELRLGTARLFSGENEHPVTFKSMTDAKTINVGTGKPHGARENPITRFAASVDLEGRTVGIVEPMIPLQDRINQTIFDMLIVQSFASFKVRTVSGMAPPFKMTPVHEDPNDATSPIVDWEPLIDPETGKPVPDKVDVNASRFLFAEDEGVRFGTLDETPLDGFIKAIEMAFRHMAALSQTPPHHILGQIANLSAEALQAAEISLSRKVAMFQSSFGESWERVFRIAGQMDGAEADSEDYSGEVVWRDMEQKSLAQAGDALGKLADQLGIPKRGLWKRVPDVTATELLDWERLADEEDAAQALANATNSASTPRPSYRTTNQGQDEVEVA